MKEADDSGPRAEARDAGGPMLPIEQQVARGMRFAHLMVLAAQRQGQETARLAEELTKLLIAKGIASDAEWTETLCDQRKDLGDLPL